MSVRLPTDAFGRSTNSGGNTVVSSGPTIDTSQFVKKAGDTMSGELNMGSNKIVTSYIPTNDDDVVTLKHTKDASKLTTGKIDKERIPNKINYLEMERNAVFLRERGSANHFLSDGVYGGYIYAHLDGREGIVLSVGGAEFQVMRDDFISYRHKILKDIKEIQTDNRTDTIVLNDSGLTLADHTLRFRGATDDNNSVRWFNGDLTTGQARLELSASNRLRLSTYQNKTGGYDNPRTFMNTQNQFIELLHDRFDVNRNRIVNVADPTDGQDAVTKAYIEKHFQKITDEITYKKILDTYSPTFWISSKFPLGLKNDQTTIQDLTGNGLTIAGTVNRDMQFGLTSRLTSTSTFTTKFTFFIKAKKTVTRAGRVFTSSTGNKLFGWWNIYNKCAWMEGNIYGVTSNTQADDREIHTYIMTNNEDTKRLYDEKVIFVSSTTDGDSSWAGSIVIGQPSTQSTENSEFQIYEVIGFNKVLTETEIYDIYDSIIA